jgi:hypothetical protein
MNIFFDIQSLQESATLGFLSDRYVASSGMDTWLLINWYSGGGVEPNWVDSALRPLIGLLCQPQAIVMMEKLMEWLAGETEVLGENLPQCRFVNHKSHMTRPGFEPGPSRWEASD